MQNKVGKEDNFLNLQSEDGCKRVFHIVMNMKPDDAEEGDIDALDKLITSNPEYLQVQSNVSFPFQNPSDIYSRDEKGENETDFTPLQIAILNHAPPEVVEILLSVGNLNIKTSKGRTARECAESLTTGEELSDESSTKVKNAFAAIDLIDTHLKNSLRVIQLRRTVKITQSLVESIVEGTGVEEVEKFDAKSKWMTLKCAILLTNSFSDNLLLTNSKLGPKVDSDSHPSVRAAGFKLPKNLDKITLDIEVPAGFKRLRKALLESTSPFLADQYIKEKMKNKKVSMEKWNKHDNDIGSHNPKIDFKGFIGATTKLQYVMPKSLMVSANTAYETTAITEYNDDCFAVKKITKNPEVPYGKKFETHTQWVFVNSGSYKCHMICSMSAVFPKGKPMVAWKIKNGMISGCTESHVALAETIVEHAGNE
mmetsp:Transcript_29495/g.35073  ORF Transcript_29495/g.35073 Transcript_29495/m.35073 type:complete len:424 (-) Transcript_29495:154-1425(-)